MLIIGKQNSQKFEGSKDGEICQNFWPLSSQV